MATTYRRFQKVQRERERERERREIADAPACLTKDNCDEMLIIRPD